MRERDERANKKMNPASSNFAANNSLNSLFLFVPFVPFVVNPLVVDSLNSFSYLCLLWLILLSLILL
jgi:hypothetical protein